MSAEKKPREEWAHNCTHPRLPWSKQCRACYLKNPQGVLRHGHNRRGKQSPTYNAWAHAIQRCTNPNYRRYDRYGGRGITVCERWRGPGGVGFANFLDDMGERPPGLTLDRIDNDGNYEPGNCRWATWSEQASNKSRRPVQPRKKLSAEYWREYRRKRKEAGNPVRGRAG